MRRFEPSCTRDEALFRPTEETSRRFYVAVAVLLAVVLFTACMYVRQLIKGLAVTGMMQPVTWGFYIISFVFFIGISHAGTLISLPRSSWRSADFIPSSTSGARTAS